MVALFMFFLIWLSPLLFTIALACPVRPASWLTASSGGKVSWDFKNNLKKPQQFYVGDDY